MPVPDNKTERYVHSTTRDAPYVHPGLDSTLESRLTFAIAIQTRAISIVPVWCNRILMALSYRLQSDKIDKMIIGARRRLRKVFAVDMTISCTVSEQ